MRPKKTNQALAVFGQTVRTYRLAKGLTQEQLAELADLHFGYLGALERGEKNISLLNIVSISEALQVPPSALIAVLDVIAVEPTNRQKTTS